MVGGKLEDDSLGFVVVKTQKPFQAVCKHMVDVRPTK